jgi:hypothetical protein
MQCLWLPWLVNTIIKQASFDDDDDCLTVIGSLRTSKASNSHHAALQYQYVVRVALDMLILPLHVAAWLASWQETSTPLHGFPYFYVISDKMRHRSYYLYGDGRADPID